MRNICARLKHRKEFICEGLIPLRLCASARDLKRSVKVSVSVKPVFFRSEAGPIMARSFFFCTLDICEAVIIFMQSEIFLYVPFGYLRTPDFFLDKFQ